MDKIQENKWKRPLFCPLCANVPLNCPWIVTSNDETLKVIITCLKWTFNYDFWIWVTVHPKGNSNRSKQIDLDDYHLLLKSLSEVLNIYEAFPEPHLNSFQLEGLEKLIEYLYLKFERNIMAETHLADPDLALDKFAGTDPDQDAESFIQLIERKINFAIGDALVNPDALANYNFRKRISFPLYLKLLPHGKIIELTSLLDFLMDETNLATN